MRAGEHGGGDVSAKSLSLSLSAPLFTCRQLHATHTHCFPLTTYLTQSPPCLFLTLAYRHSVSFLFAPRAAVDRALTAIKAALFIAPVQHSKSPQTSKILNNLYAWLKIRLITCSPFIILI